MSFLPIEDHACSPSFCADPAALVPVDCGALVEEMKDVIIVEIAIAIVLRSSVFASLHDGWLTVDALATLRTPPTHILPKIVSAPLTAAPDLAPAAPPNRIGHNEKEGCR